MAEWVYIVGEDDYTQTFKAFEGNQRVDLSSFINPRLFIQSSDGLTNFPTGGTAISIGVSTNEFQVPVAVGFMPQTEGVFICTIQVNEAGGQVRYTFEFNLEVRLNRFS
jgi:hypothetical protein